nr:cyclic nucleotide-gated cation channel beta-1-like [Ciona intestinalis]|eukprot:XP_002125558.1 cyclic nucleotide-gated cation channel beta-1-like [Ciona intestinalis]
MDEDGELRISPTVQSSFEKWHRVCEARAHSMHQHLFEHGDSSSDEETKSEDVRAHKQDDTMFQHEVEQSLFKQIRGYRFPKTINPETDMLYLFWQFLASLSLVYNAICIPLRTCFPFQTSSNISVWMTVDYLADMTYIVDVFLFQIRRQYILGGVMQEDPILTKKEYLKSERFKKDVVAMLPTDLLYIAFGVKPAFRINRLVRTNSYFEFNNRFEMLLKRAYVYRIARTTCYLLYVIHLDACFYYWLSYLSDFKSEWGYLLEGNAYVRCYFWAFMTTVTIGNVPEPVTTIEYLVQIFNYFAGLFIFSIVIGQVRDSVHSATAEQETYRSQKNSTIDYMQKNHIPVRIQNKVRLWFEYTWNTQRILDETALLKQMPDKMHTDLAINVHMDVLSKVEIFKECDKQLLYDLLLHLKPILYLPGDYVCKKGEVGREMYIITNGMVQVVGDTSSVVFASLHPGTAFGEISLLAVGGGNRRTANIYSPGYTTLFILYKNDLNGVLKNHPEAQKILKSKARKMLKKDNSKKKPAPPVSTVPTPVNTNGGGGLIKTILHVAKMTNIDLKHLKTFSLKNKNAADKTEKEERNKED